MGRLLAIIAGIGEGVYGRWMFKRLLSGIFTVVAFTIIISMLVGALLIGSLAAAYMAFINAGFESHIAALLTAALCVMVILALVLLMLGCVRRLQRLPHGLETRKSQILAKANAVAESFLDGFLNPPSGK